MAVVGKKPLNEKVFDFINVVIMLFICFVIVYPFLNIVSISLSGDNAILRGEVTIYPVNIDLSGYKMVFSSNSIIRAYGNTLFVAGVGCLLSLIMTSFAAYPLAYSNFIGYKFYNIMIVITLWFNGGMIPSYMVMRNIGLLNSSWSLIVSSLLGAYNIIILKSFFSSIPASLLESARIDGANDFGILIRIVWPLSKPALATISLWVIVGHWNDFFAPLMYLNDFRKYTLQLVLRDIVMQASSLLYGIENTSAIKEGGVAAISEQVKNAVIVVSMIPMLVIYPFLQKYFVTGIMLGAVKG